MRAWWVLIVGVLAAVAAAQEPPKADELQKMYDDALAQLKSAQDRKNELGVENEQLRAKLAETEKQLTDAAARADALAVQVNSFADQTFQLRSWQSAWKLFLETHPALKSRWGIFLENELLSVPRQLPEFLEPDWPLSAAGE